VLRRGRFVAVVAVAAALLAGCGDDNSGAGTGNQAKAAQARREARQAHRQQQLRQARQQARALARRAAQREARRKARQKAAAQPSTPTTTTTTTSSTSACDPNYSGACLDPNSSDYDCEGGTGDGPDYTGPVTVVGTDHYDLDSDGDGQACES
jgi:hypothetical protein